MNTATDTAPASAGNAENKTEAAASGLELATQATRALVNQGDTVRASWRFSLDAIRANIAYMSPEAKEALVWAFAWCIDPAHPIGFEDFCDRVGYNTNTVYKMYSGKYKHPETDPEKPNFGKKMDAPEKLLKAVRSFRRLEVARSRMGEKKFVMTATAARIYWGIEQARKSGRPVMIYGASQIGKTEAFIHNSIDFNHGKTRFIPLEAVNGLRGMLQAIAIAIGVGHKAATPKLIQRIKNALTSDMVLILDEVHLLANVYRKGSFFACMEQLRRIWDAKRFGLVLGYTDLGYDKAEQERKRELIQIFRRSALKINLGSTPLVEDVRAFVASYGLDWNERHEEVEVAKGVSDTPWKVLQQLAEEEGITAIIERFRLAHERAADRESSEVTWHDFMTAHFAVQQQAQAPVTGWDKKRAA